MPQPTTASSFSLISLNVLLPNSHDGWWIYKYYPPSVAAAETTWSARSRLLEELLLKADADIICLQECCAASFESDFSFLQRAGYSASLLGKGRMRPATLWKTSRFALCDAAGAPAPPPPETPPHETTTDAEGPAAAGHGGAADADECEWAALPATRGAAVTQGDRTLITTLQLLGEDGSPRGTPPLFVVNCHLTAGQEARRRLSQVHDALDRVRKQRAKALPKGHDPRAPCVVCGDFNSQGSTAVRELLLRGEVLPSFRESGDPTELDQAGTALTSKPKRQGVGAFTDVYECVEGGCGPTLVAPTLQPLMQREDGGVTDLLRAALAEAFLTLSADGETLSLEEQRRWLVAVNKEEGRGSEWRAAAAAREVRGSDSLDLDAFVGVYEAEVAQGKFWGVEHDLRVLRGEGVAQQGAPPFTATFDYLYCSDAIEVLGVRAPLDRGEPRAEALLKGESWLPNEWHASDHLPVGAALALAPNA